MCFFWECFDFFFNPPICVGKMLYIWFAERRIVFLKMGWAKNQLLFKIIFQTSNAWRFSQTSKNPWTFFVTSWIYIPKTPSGCNYWQKWRCLVWGISSKPRNGSPRHPCWAARNPWGVDFSICKCHSFNQKWPEPFRILGWHPKLVVKRGMSFKR